jgi:hypothetical protein
LQRDPSSDSINRDGSIS